jgi:SP family xylose:H+ symportor-like MFS transporter
MKRGAFGYLLIASFTGFLFAFDSVVISGVNLPLKDLWKTSEWFHGAFIISASMWGTLLGSLLGGYPTEAFGRKRTLLYVGFMFTLSGLVTAFATTPYVFSFFRFLGGLAAGVGAIAAPTYIAEMASAKDRGKLAMLFQFNVVLGILAAFLSNYLMADVGGENSWRLMLGVMAIPAALYSVLLFRIAESPRWLIRKKQDVDKALQILNKTNSKEEALSILQMIRHSPVDAQDHVVLFSHRNMRVLMLSFLIAFFNQFSGISFILFYAPEILEKGGWVTTQSLLGTVSIGLVNVAFTIIGIFLIDKVGRKPLMYLGSVGYIVSLSMISFSFYASSSATITLIFILLFIISHAIGQGAVIWVFIAEIFPTRIRAFGQAWGAGLLNGFAALITLFGSVLINFLHPWKVFAFFAFLMTLQLLFVHFLMPETKGASLEELENRLT